MTTRTILCTLLLASCTRQAVIVEPRYLFRGIPALRATGEATLDVSPSGTHTLHSDDVLEVPFRKETKKLTIAQLVENCPEVAPFREDGYRRDPPCLLLETTTDALRLDTRVRPNWDVYKVIGGALIVTLVLGVVVGYVIECKEGDDGC